MEIWIQLQRRKIDQRFHKEKDKQNENKKMKFGNQFGLICRKIRNFSELNLMKSIGNVEIKNNGPWSYQIYTINIFYYKLLVTSKIQYRIIV